MEDMSKSRVSRDLDSSFWSNQSKNSSIIMNSRPPKNHSSFSFPHRIFRVWMLGCKVSAVVRTENAREREGTFCFSFCDLLTPHPIVFTLTIFPTGLSFNPTHVIFMMSLLAQATTFHITESLFKLFFPSAWHIIGLCFNTQIADYLPKLQFLQDKHCISKTKRT